VEIRRHPRNWKKADVTPIYKKGLKEDPGDYRPISLTSVPVKVMERILLGAITSQMKNLIGKSQHGSTKGKWCFTNLIASCDKVTCSGDVGKQWTLSTWISPRLLIWFSTASSWRNWCFVV